MPNVIEHNDEQNRSRREEEHITERHQYNRNIDNNLAELASFIKHDAPTFTMSQVLAGAIAILSIAGSLIATWTSLNSQITTIKVSTDLIFAQISKDQNQSNLMTQEFRSKIDVNLKELSDKIEDMNLNISQLNNKRK